VLKFASQDSDLRDQLATIIVTAKRYANELKQSTRAANVALTSIGR